MKKTSKTSKKSKAKPTEADRGEAPVSTRGPSTRGLPFTPMKLSGLSDSSKQFNAEGFKR